LTSVRSRLKYAPIAWNTLTAADTSKLVHIQQKFLALCHNRFFPQVNYIYVKALDHLNFHTLCSRRCYLHAPFLLTIYNDFKFCLTLKLLACMFYSKF
jgi:hypothetical protein